MRKYFFLQILFVFLLLVSYEASSYGQSKFSEHYNQGLEFYKQGKYDQAGKAFENALELKPNDVYALYGLGNTLYCKAKYDEAVKIYSKAIKINPDYAKVHYSLSLAYSKLGMIREAEEEKKIFRKLTQGERGVAETDTKAKPAHTEKKIKAKIPEVKKDEVITAEKKILPIEKSVEKQAERKLQEAKKAFEEIQRAPVKEEIARDEDSQTIFKGYAKETPSAKPRVYTKRYGGKLFDMSKPWIYMKEKWSSSGVNKIVICIIGYIIATQMWLCTVAFFGLVIWKIRSKTE